MKGSFWSYVIGYVGLPLFIIWASYKLVLWALLSINVPLWWADKTGILVSLFVIGVMIRLKIGRSPRAAVANASQTTETGIKVKEYVFLLQTAGKPLKITKPYEGMFVGGGAGAGKSFGVIEQILVQSIEQDFTGLVYDYKFPTFANVVNSASKSNRSQVKQYYVNFDDLTRSHRVNPIDPRILINSSLADNAADTVMANLSPKGSGDNFFVDNATAYLSGIIWYLREEHPHLCTLPHAMALAIQSPDKVIPLLMQNDEVAGTVASILTALERKAEGQISAVVSTLQNSLRKINTRSIVWILSGSDLTLDLNNPEEPKMLTIGNNPELDSVYGPVLALITSVTIKKMNQKNKAKAIVILDEAPTLYIPDFSRIPTTARSNQVATLFGAQDFSQIVTMYGQEEKDTILANLGNKFYGRMTHLASAEYVSKMWGKEYVEQVSQSIADARSGEMSGSKSKSYSATQRDRVEVQEVANLRQGEFLGQLIESDVSYFRASMKPKPIKRDEIPAFKQVTEDDVKANFRRIKEEIQQLLDGVKLTTPLAKSEPSKPDLERSRSAPEPVQAQPVPTANKKVNDIKDEF